MTTYMQKDSSLVRDCLNFEFIADITEENETTILCSFEEENC